MHKLKGEKIDSLKGEQATFHSGNQVVVFPLNSKLPLRVCTYEFKMKLCNLGPWYSPLAFSSRNTIVSKENICVKTIFFVLVFFLGGTCERSIRSLGS
jgi:hypothetical protein